MASNRFHHRAFLRAVVILITVVALLVAFADAARAQDAGPTPTMPGHGHHDHGDSEQQPTAEEQAAADQLVQATRESVARFADVAVAEAAGYRIVTPFAFYGARAAHYQNATHAKDDQLLNPERPEDLVYLKRDDGQLVLLGVMYLAPIGQGPVVGGPLTRWHAHDDLCANVDGVVPRIPTGECPAGTRPLDVEMLHVWLVDHPEGPFADGPPPSAVTVPVGPLVAGGSLAVGASLVDSTALAKEVGEVLGLSLPEVGWRFAAGESLAEMAADQEVPREEVVRVIENRLSLDYDRAVASGDMTAGQRDLLLQTLPMTAERLVELHAGEPWLLASTVRCCSRQAD